MIDVFNSLVQILVEYLNKFIDGKWGTYDPVKKTFVKKPKEKPKSGPAAAPIKPKGFVRKSNWKK